MLPSCIGVKGEMEKDIATENSTTGDTAYNKCIIIIIFMDVDTEYHQHKCN